MGKRKRTAKRFSPGVPIDAYFSRQMKDPEFAKDYEELAPEFEVVEQIVALRLKRNLSQRELAKKVGTQQPSIARLERKRRTNDLGFLRRVADALDARLEVRLVPREASSGKRAGQKRTAKNRIEADSPRNVGGARGDGTRQGTRVYAALAADGRC